MAVGGLVSQCTVSDEVVSVKIEPPSSNYWQLIHSFICDSQNSLTVCYAAATAEGRLQAIVPSVEKGNHLKSTVPPGPVLLVDSNPPATPTQTLLDICSWQEAAVHQDCQ